MRLGFLAQVLILVSGCALGQHPRIDVSPAIEDGHVVFNIPHSEINGLLALEVEEGNERLWAANLQYEKGHKIVYGVVPTNTNPSRVDPKQTFPPAGQAPAGIRGKTVNVRIEYQYDQRFAPYATWFEKAIVIP